MRTLIKTVLLGTVFSSGIVYGNSAKAADEKHISLNTVTVVATRSEADIHDVPAQVDVIETEQPGNSVITDVQDLFRDTPSVQLTGGPRSNGQDFVMRGFATNSILKTLDGTRLNYESAHDGQFFIDPRMLKKVEVVRGASSSIYGGGAMGGVVAFETKDAADMLKPGQKKGYSVGLDYRSANQLVAPTLSLFQRGDAFDIITNFNYANSGDIKQGGGSELNADDTIYNGFGKVKWFVNDALELNASFIGYNADNGKEPNNGTEPVNTTDNFESKKDVTQHISTLGYKYNPDNDLIDASAKIYLNDTDVEETVNDGGANQGRLSSRKLQTWGGNFDNQSRFTTGGEDGTDHILSYGAEYYEDEQQASRSTGGGVPGTPSGETMSWGAYLQDEVKLLNEKLTLIPAVRYDYYQSEQKGTTGTFRDDDQFSPKLAAVYDINDNVNIFASAAKAFRAPKVTELYPTGNHFPISFFPVLVFNTFLPNPNLKPETSNNYEIGSGLKYQDVLTDNDTLDVKASVYRTKAEDFISQSVSVNAGANTQYLNADKAEINGYEIDLNYDSESFRVISGLAYSKAYDTSANTYLSESQPLTLTTNIGYKLPEHDSIVGWRGTFASSTTNVPAAEQRGGYGVHDIYAEWTPDAKNLEGLKLNLSVTNIFDKRYTPNFSQLFEEGRSFNAGVTYTVGLN